jgi:hypothetical protein
MGLISRRHLVGLALLGTCTAVGAARADTPAERFRTANEAARGLDYPKALLAYRELAAAGQESASLYWNWAQAAAARGEQGEALWALLRAGDLDPADRAVVRETVRLTEALALDPAELAPDPRTAVARVGRRFRLDLVAAGLLLLAGGLAVAARLAAPSRRLRPAGLIALGLSALTTCLLLVGATARPLGVVVRRGAPLLDAASPTAEAVGALREGEVVPLLQQSGGFVRVEDSSGARGWASALDVRALDRPPEGSP